MVKEFKLGVLFVHGIGSQKQGETLVSFGEPLAACLSGMVPLEIEDATVVRGADERGLSHTKWTVGGTRWLVAESWWSETFREPGYARLALWTLRVAPWTLALHFKTRLKRAMLRAPKSENWGPVVTSPRVMLSLVYLLAALAVAPVLAATIILMLVLGWIPKVRDFALAVQRVLAGSVGDSYILLHSPIQRAAIEARVRRDLVSLSDRCERVAVIAHSQGAAIAHSVVRGSALKNVTLLATMGSGLSKLWALRKSQETDELARTWLASAGAILGIVATPSFVQVIASVGFLKILFRIAGYVAGVAVGMAFQPSGNAPRNWIVRVRALLMIASLLAGLSSFAWALIPVMNAMGPVPWVGFGGVLLLVFALGSGGRIGEPSPEEFERDFQLRAGTGWVDFYSDTDLVPTGPLTEKVPCGALESHRVDNVGSLLSDHTSYWQNPEGVVARIAAALLAAAGLKGPDEWMLVQGERRRRYRVHWLVLVRISIGAVALALIAWHWRHIHLLMPAPALDLLKNAAEASLPRSAIGEGLVEQLVFSASRTVGISAVLLAAWTSYRALFAMWKTWERSDASTFRKQASYALAPVWFWLFFIGALALVEAAILIPLFPHRLFEAFKVSVISVGLTIMIGGFPLKWRILPYAAMQFLLIWPPVMLNGPNVPSSGFWMLLVLLAQIPVARLIKRPNVQEWLRRVTAARHGGNMYYSVVSVSETDPRWVNAYIPAVRALVEKHGGRYLVRAQKIKRMEGQGANPSALVVIQWPDEAAANAFYQDPAYAPFLKAGLAGSTGDFFNVPGLA